MSSGGFCHYCRKANCECSNDSINRQLLEALKGMIETYAPRARETAQREGFAVLHNAVQDALTAIDKAEGRL